MKKIIVGAASAVAITAVIALAGCGSVGTTTVKELAPAPVTHTSAPAKPSPAVTKTVAPPAAPSDTGYEVCTGGNNAYAEFTASSTVPQQASGQLVNVNTLTNSVADEQQAALAAAPSSDYDSPDNAIVTVTLTSLGDRITPTVSGITS
jgi:hypothetical protein